MKKQNQNNRVLGVDIGSTGIRIVEVENSNKRIQLINYGQAEFLRPIDLDFMALRSKNLVVDAIKKIKKQAKFTTNEAYGVIPGKYCFHKVVEFEDKCSDDVIRAYIKKHVAEEVPFDDNFIINWKQLASNNKTKVLANAVPEKLLSKYKEIFKEAGLNLIGLESTYYALTRSLVGSDNVSTMIIDVGGYYTDIALIEKGAPRITSSMPAGGEAVTHGLMKFLRVGRDEAEQFKKDNNMFLIDNERNKEEYDVFLEDWQNNIRQYLSEAQNPEKIIITGGCSFDKNLVKHLNRITKVNSFIGNPWGRISCGNIDRQSLNRVVQKYAVAAGAAMRVKNS